MRILHVTEALGGGVQSAISKYTSLADAGQHMVYGRVRSGESAGEFGANTKVFEHKGSIFGLFFTLHGVIKEFQPDIIHFHSSIAGVARALSPINIPIVYSPHCYAFERQDKSALWLTIVRIVEKVLSFRSQVVIAVSPHEVNLAKSLNNSAMVQYVPNIFLADLDSIPKSDRLSVVMVGRIGRQKDPQLFASVASRLRDRYDFIWVGDGDSESRIQLENAGVYVSGWIRPSEARKLVARSHLYFHSGAWEAAPISTIEAASVGTPVLARGILTMKSLGYVTTGHTPGEISRLIDKFFTDANFFEFVSAQTRTVASRFDRGDCRRLLIEAYECAESEGVPIEN